METGVGHRDGYAAYQQTRYFPSLDGLRAVSILLVVTAHMGDPLWDGVHGWHGVTIFFVLSGYLITTLLLREEDRTGRVSVSNFYIRRAFRIFPLYYLALGVYAVLVLGLHLGDGGRDEFTDALPYYLTYMNELGSAATFGHSWSLGIEEKFYLLWPLLAFGALALRRWRPAIATALLLGAAFTPLVFPYSGYLRLYVPILLGCLVGLLMHQPRVYALTMRTLARTGPAVVLIVAAGVVEWRSPEPDHYHPLFGLLIALLLPAVLGGPAWLRAALSSRWMVFVGTRSYAVYLFHPIAKNIVDMVIAPGSGAALEVVRFLLAVAVSRVGADIVHRLVERPMIGLGRRLTKSEVPANQLPPVRPRQFVAPE